MIIISEERFYNRSVYYKTEVDEFTDEIISKTRYDCRVFVLKDKKTIFIGDRLQNIRQEPFCYVNDQKRNCGIGSRLQMATAIQLYYSYCDLFNVDPEMITQKQIQKLIQFLKGTDIQSEIGDKVTNRSVETIKQYLGMISKYLEYSGFESGGLNRTYMTYTEIRIGTSAHLIDTKGKYGSDLRSGRMNKLKAPSHFTPTQANDLLDVIFTAKDVTMFCIFKLGYMFGLRRGEILGLTKNDVVIHRNNKTGDTYELILRNRISDNTEQSVKRLLHPKRPEDYSTIDYLKSQRRKKIDEETYNLLLNYYKTSRNIKDKKKLKTLKEKFKADKCTENEPENYYMFPISGQTVNNHLKKYFRQAGIEVNNVSHALRHSYAMYITHYSSEPCGIEEAGAALGHQSPRSTEIYTRITEQEETELRNKFSEELKTLIPKLKKDKI